MAAYHRVQVVFRSEHARAAFSQFWNSMMKVRVARVELEIGLTSQINALLVRAGSGEVSRRMRH